MGLAVLIIVSAALAAAYMYFLYRPDPGSFPLRGIDVSHHQGEIDWRKVAGDEVAFAYIKATEGGDHRDSRFTANWQQARDAGIKVGAYHFFTFCRPGRDQAANFLATLGASTPMLPPALDLEFGGNCSNKPSDEAMLQEISSFLQDVEGRTGQQAVLYVTPEFWGAYKNVLPQRPIWFRSLFRQPKDVSWAFWQYHNSSRVDGIKGPVDLNVFHGGWDALQALEQKAP
jgi:lysozyme